MTESAFKRAVVAHREGRVDIARSLYERAIMTEPCNAHAHFQFGRFECELGRLQAAIRLLRAALAMAPGDASIAVELSRALAMSGNLEEATQALESVLARGVDDVALRFKLGLLHTRAGNMTEAAKELERVLVREPFHSGALLELGRIRVASGNPGDARLLLERAVRVEPSDFESLVLLARLIQELDDNDEAVLALLEQAAGLPSVVRPDAHILLSRAREAAGDADGALRAAISATARFPGHDIAWRHLGDLRKRRGELSLAVEAFETAHAILRDPEGDYGLERPEILNTTRAKLRHDIDQLRYLKDQGTLEAEAPLKAHISLLSFLPSSLGDGEVVQLLPSAIRRTGGHYNRCLFRVEAPEITTGAINPSLDRDAIIAEYRHRAPGIVWFDDFLRPAAVESLRHYLLCSTIWYDADHPNGYVGAYLHDGFTCPLVLQIARELPEILPEIFGDLPLLQLWAYHYDSELAGIGMHADFAAVNVNFWLTPDDALLDPESGGMVIWDKEAPKNWSMRDYNTSDLATKERIDAFLEAENANSIRIAYRQNRVVIFNSDLFHRTDDICFRDEFENRRLNVTMLYGNRG